MIKNYLWTKLKARLQFIRATCNGNYNWIFLPGGPGLGSESLEPLTKNLSLPGTMWHLDLPGDGSNVTADDYHYFSHWQDALVEAVQTLSNVIIVAHSTGGMYVLSAKRLEGLLSGLVLMDSAPDASWQQVFIEYVNQHPLPEVEHLQKIYAQSPNNQALKNLTIASAPYFVKSLNTDISFLQSLPFNYKACEWSAEHFDPYYKANWLPSHIPTLILAGDSDCITPLNLFRDLDIYHHDNILIQEIQNAGHYPWLENLSQVIQAFQIYCQKLDPVK